MKNKLFIIDIKKKISNKLELNKLISQNSTILSLTPYSCFLLTKYKIKYDTFHSIISIGDFKKNVLDIYQKYNDIFDKYQDLSYLFKDLSSVITYEEYINTLYHYIQTHKQMNYEIIYITDTTKEKDIKRFKLNSNETSGLYYFDIIDQFISTHNFDDSFYTKMKRKLFFSQIRYANSFFHKIKSLILKLPNKYYLYDNSNYRNFWESQQDIEIQNLNFLKKYDLFKQEITRLMYSKERKEFLIHLYKNVFLQFQDIVLSNKKKTKITVKPFVYISTNEDYLRSLIYKKNHIPKVFMQHGAYIYDHIFLKYHEVLPADVNFVFNEFTKNEFQKIKKDNIIKVGSSNFNKKMKKHKLIYDYVYITYCTTYGHNASYIDGVDSMYAMDANNIYNIHKDIISFFGEQLSDKKICIKIQPGIYSGSMMYVPFKELSQKFKNITINFDTPLKILISQSKNIISDYFSSEFINREIHYKKNIFLFQNNSLSIPENLIMDMKKMFIVVDSIQELNNKIKDHSKIINRKKYNKIIEYYSSPNIDTEAIVNKTLQKIKF